MDYSTIKAYFNEIEQEARDARVRPDVEKKHDLTPRPYKVTKTKDGQITFEPDGWE